jgi:hypothetical protein
MMMIAKTVPALALCAFTVSACMPGGTPAQMATAMAGFSGVTQATTPPSKADLAMSCKDVNARLGNLYARYNQLEAEQQAKQRKSAMVDGALDIGLGILGTGMATGAGSVSAIRNAQLATTVGGGAIGLARAESSAVSLKDVNDTTAIATRTAQLEKVKLEKGC